MRHSRAFFRFTKLPQNGGDVLLHGKEHPPDWSSQDMPRVSIPCHHKSNQIHLPILDQQCQREYLWPGQQHMGGVLNQYNLHQPCRSKHQHSSPYPDQVQTDNRTPCRMFHQDHGPRIHCQCAWRYYRSLQVVRLDMDVGQYLQSPRWWDHHQCYPGPLLKDLGDANKLLCQLDNLKDPLTSSHWPFTSLASVIGINIPFVAIVVWKKRRSNSAAPGMAMAPAIWPSAPLPPKVFNITAAPWTVTYS